MTPKRVKRIAWSVRNQICRGYKIKTVTVIFNNNMIYYKIVYFQDDILFPAFRSKTFIMAAGNSLVLLSVRYEGIDPLQLNLKEVKTFMLLVLSIVMFKKNTIKLPFSISISKLTPLHIHSSKSAIIQLPLSS